MSDTKLLTCPFCGGEAEIIYTDFNRNLGYVNCKNCYCRTDGDIIEHNIDASIEKWNTRKPIERIIEKMEEAKIDGNYTEAICQRIGINKAISIIKEEGGING